MLKISIQFIAMFIFLTLCNLGFAEYKAITEFPKCQLIGGSSGCKGVVDPDQLEKSRQQGVTDVDVQACQTITDNINAMEKYHVNWGCDFPISSNIYTLSKPQWQEVTGEEKQQAWQALYKTMPAVTPPKNIGITIFGFPYNIDAKEGDEKLYVAWSDKTSCDNEKYPNKNTLWFSDKFKYSFNNFEPVTFASRLYFVEYSPIIGGEKEFVVSSMMMQEPYTGFKVNGLVCEIKPLNSSKSN